MGKYTDPSKEFKFTEFSLVEFRKLFGISTVLSALSLSLLHAVVIELHLYYGSEKFFEDMPFYLEGIKGIIFFMLINHVFFRIDSGKLTNISERVVLDLLFIIVFFLLRIVHGSLSGVDFDHDFGPKDFAMTFMLVFIIFCFEIVMAIVLYILRFIWSSLTKSK